MPSNISAICWWQAGGRGLFVPSKISALSSWQPFDGQGELVTACVNDVPLPRGPVHGLFQTEAVNKVLAANHLIFPLSLTAGAPRSPPRSHTGPFQMAHTSKTSPMASLGNKNVLLCSSGKHCKGSHAAAVFVETAERRSLTV